MSEGSNRYPVPSADPEKGELEPSAPIVDAVVKPLDTAINGQSELVAVPDTKEVVPIPTKAPPKPKQKVSRWVRWQLWFNMYR